jgi:hypothetical protein
MSNLRQALDIGEFVILDKGFRNQSTVAIVRQTPNRLFSTVKSKEGSEWDVMTNRLTKLK